MRSPAACSKVSTEQREKFSQTVLIDGRRVDADVDGSPATFDVFDERQDFEPTEECGFIALREEPHPGSLKLDGCWLCAQGRRTPPG